MDLQEALNSISSRLNNLEARRQTERFITMELANGEKVTAPVGIWFQAFCESMEPEVKQKLIETMVKVRDNHVAKNTIYAPSTTSIEELVKAASKQVPTRPTGQIAYTDFSVDKNGKKHYVMHCDPGNYAGTFKGK